MCWSKWILVAVLTWVIMLSGCSHTASPVESAIGEDVYTVGDKNGNRHSMLGLYTIVCRPEAGTVEVIPLRDAGLHLNALKFLEPPPFVYLTIEGAPEFNENILNVDIVLRHPFPDQDVYTGFDVCGIIFTHGSIAGFNDPDVVMAGEGDTRLINADGYTRWWNPTEFPHGDKIDNYIDGLFGNPADTSNFNCTLNGYKYFADGLGKDEPLTALNPEERGVFSAGAKNTRHYIIDLSGEPEFNYAVDACWKFPQGGPPIDVPDDFPPQANRPEAWNVEVTEITNTLHFSGSPGTGSGELKLLIDVWDHFDPGSNTVRGESLAGLPLTSGLTPVGGGEGFSTYELDFTGENLTQNGDVEILITVESDTTGYGNVLTDKPVCAYFKHGFNIYFGWARTWGGSDTDAGSDVAIDDIGNTYVAGYFHETVDFDPGPGEEEHTSNSVIDIFLSKFDPNGDFLWVRTWGGIGDPLFSLEVASDGSGNTYITGAFSGTVDFNPGPGVDEHTSNGFEDIYLIKVDSNGDFQWARTWGGSGWDVGHGVAIDGDGNAYVTGHFWNTVDFDPGPGVEEHTSNEVFDAFLSKFDPNGDFQWARTWGGSYEDYGRGVAIDGSGNAYVTGSFWNTVDFDPGPGTDEHTPNGDRGLFLSKLDSNGDFQWARTWDGGNGNMSRQVAVDGGGNAYVTGYFYYTVDFDPGPGVDEHTSNGPYDIFLSKFNSSGDFQWALTWGGNDGEIGWDVAVDGNGNAYVTGNFSGTVDFDPGPGVDEHTPNGGYDIFLSKFDTIGDFQWACTWGGDHGDGGSGVAIDGIGNTYVTGNYRDTVDFAPSLGVDEHTSNGECDAFLIKFPPDGNW